LLDDMIVSAHFTSQDAQHPHDPRWRACCANRPYRGLKTTTPGKEVCFGSDLNASLPIARGLPTSLRSLSRRPCGTSPPAGVDSPRPAVHTAWAKFGRLRSNPFDC
jgi:hypothetical protein